MSSIVMDGVTGADVVVSGVGVFVSSSAISIFVTPVDGGSTNALLAAWYICDQRSQRDVGCEVVGCGVSVAL